MNLLLQQREYLLASYDAKMLGPINLFSVNCHHETHMIPTTQQTFTCIVCVCRRLNFKSNLSNVNLRPAEMRSFSCYATKINGIDPIHVRGCSFRFILRRFFYTHSLALHTIPHSFNFICGSQLWSIL